MNWEMTRASSKNPGLQSASSFGLRKGATPKARSSNTGQRQREGARERENNKHTKQRGVGIWGVRGHGSRHPD